METTEHAVVIAGGGPTGLMLAGELALANVDVAVVERRGNQDLDGLRAGGLNSRTVEVLDQRGIAGRFAAQAQVARMAPFAGITLDITGLPTRHNYFLAIWQTEVERILAGWVGEKAVPVYRGCEVTGFGQDETGVDIELSGGRSLRARYLVGCDGGRSLIRKKAGIAFPGREATVSYLIAEIETAEEPQWGFRRTEHGILAIGKLDGGKRARVVLQERHIQPGNQPSLPGGRDQAALGDVRNALIAAYETDFGLRSASYISRFTDMTRQAASYRERRVLLAGDAAHVHSPIGGQGLNLGLQDAVNLGWKLASVVLGWTPESLLDTYHAERHPVGARVLRNTMALTALESSGDRVEALRNMLCEMLQRGNEVRKQYFAMMFGLDINYDFGKGHLLLGRRMPDLDVVTGAGSRRVFELLHAGRPVFLNLGPPGAFDVSPWADRVQLAEGSCPGQWDLPLIGTVTPPTAVLIRPDGYVAWVAESTQQPGLADALTTWFGPPLT